MHDLLSITTNKVQSILQQKGSLSLTHLETMVNVSYNLLFLAIDRLSLENKIRIKKEKTDYIIYSYNAGNVPLEGTVQKRRENRNDQSTEIQGTKCAGKASST
ncbi:MAG: hypothetical protein PH343_02725 [Nitrospira sp.]|nr:hypothetical protein [Nitrospira sp.]